MEETAEVEAEEMMMMMTAGFEVVQMAEAELERLEERRMLEAVFGAMRVVLEERQWTFATEEEGTTVLEVVSEEEEKAYGSQKKKKRRAV